MSNDFHIFIATIDFQRLDKLSNKLLNEVNIDNSENTLELVRNRLGFEVEQIAIVNKCNAVYLIISYFGDYEPSFIKGRVLSAWDETASLGLVNAYRYIKSYEGIGALTHLIESALGLNSIVTGDSQVLAQICDALHDADLLQQRGYRAFPILISQIKDFAHEAKTTSKLYMGNTSLERIAAEIVERDAGQVNKIVVLGAGRTGSLVVKILSSEYGMKVLIANRTSGKRNELIAKYPGVRAIAYGNVKEVSKASHIVIAISSDQDTQRYISKILSGVNTKTLIIDLSSPSITGEIGNRGSERLIGIEKLSSMASDKLASRKSEVNKVRSMIQKRLIGCVEIINKELAQYVIDKRKESIPVKLGDNALRLLKIRNDCNQTIRKSLRSKGFLEVVTPYIVGVSSDPPRVDKSRVFSLDWPDGGTAFLRQSNQLYKQMIVASGLDRIFEIGPFWRMEENTTYRHLLESIGLDVEFSNPTDISEVYGLAYTTILTVDKSIVKSAGMSKSLLELPPISRVPVLTYRECIELLRSKGYDAKYGQDLGLIGESRLGQIIKKDRKSDALIIIDYPDTIKKFYTMRKENGETETFDIIIDGWELVSGALRNTNREQIEKSMRLSGVNVTDYSFYLSVVSNAIKHGGFCLGLDRAIAKSLGLEIISQTSAFPRTAEMLIP